MTTITPSVSPPGAVSITIGELGERSGEATHVLRHWEDMGLLHPQRTAAGHRRYTERDVTTVGVIRRLQRVGFSLPEIVDLGLRSRANRATLVAAMRDQLAARAAAIERSSRYLEHTLHCRHAIDRSCAECIDFANSSQARSLVPTASAQAEASAAASTAASAED